MNLKLTRASGAQNTFYLINAFEPEAGNKFRQFSEKQKQELARKVCLGFDEFSTDGLLFIYPKSLADKKYDFAWDFYNSDGSHAEMCGNAARCATLFYHEKIKPEQTVHFFTGAGEISGTVLNSNKVKIEMTPVSQPQVLKVLGHEGLFVNTGVPHFVICEQANEDLAKSLRKAPEFGCAGANITFVQILDAQKLTAVTFERGVERFTRACGTGAVAAAFYLRQKEAGSGVFVLMPGGELFVENIHQGKRPFLTGPVKLEFEMTLVYEDSEEKNE